MEYGTIKCQVLECQHNLNDKKICRLEAIKIGPDGFGDTDCMSYEPDDPDKKEYK